MSTVFSQPWLLKYVTEFIGTAILVVCGNSAVANVVLKGTPEHGHSLLVIAWGYGIGIMIPAFAFGTISAQLNPAFTIGLAVSGLFPWANVLPYVIAQVLGATLGQLGVVALYGPYYRQTTSPNEILASFGVVNGTYDGSRESRRGACLNGSWSEGIGSFILFIAAMGATTIFFGKGTAAAPTVQALSMVFLGFVVFAVIAAFGGLGGPSLNPARDFGPRLLHQLLPSSVLGKGKGGSQWWFAWVPELVPLVVAIGTIALFKALYL